MNIIYIDDEKDIAEMVAKILVKKIDGLSVDIAFNGVQGYEKCKNKRYDLIIADVNMPKLKGDDLLNKLNKDGIDFGIMYLISGDASLASKYDCHKFLQKPLSPFDLVDEIKLLINKD